MSAHLCGDVYATFWKTTGAAKSWPKRPTEQKAFDWLRYTGPRSQSSI
jgi:hypothetical protein